MLFARGSAVLFGLIVLAPHGLAQPELTDRLRTALEVVEQACSDDIQAFCPKVSPGEGRILLCMQAHEDQLSPRCNFALYRVSRRLDSALQRVQRTADACWTDIEAQCGSAERVGQCLVQKRTSLSPACQSTLDTIQRAVRGVVSLRGMDVYSDDDKNLGQILNVKRGSDGKIQSIDVEVGRFLGLGNKVVTIDAEKLKEVTDKVKLRIRSDQVRALPEASSK